MEKRMFLAIGLSLVVVVLYQSFFVPKPSQQADSLQTIENIEVKENKSVSDALPNIERPSTAIASFNEETFLMDAGPLMVKFTNKGGSISEIDLKKYGYILPVKNVLGAFGLNGAQFTFNNYGNKSILSAASDGWNVEKTFTVLDNNTIDVQVKVRNDADVSRSLIGDGNVFNIDNSRMDISELKSDWTLFEYGFKTAKNIKRKGSAHEFNEKWNKAETLPISWFSYRNRYFALAVMPEIPAAGYSVKMLSAKEMAVDLAFPTDNIRAGEEREFNFKIYAGPQDLAVMKAADPEFAKIMVFSDWGWLDAISKGILWVAEFVNKFIPSWGLTIILISLIIYTLMYPLTLQSLVSMRKMQTLQPQMAALKKKHEKSPEKMNQEVMALYKKNNVNPLSGCLPMLLQMPIFVGLYQVLWRSIFLRGEGFLWIDDLSMPDRLFKLPFEIPFLGPYFNILPILMAGTMFVQQAINMKSSVAVDPEQMMQQKMMAYLMPVMLGFIFYNFSSGLNLYFVVFYSLSAITQWKVSKDVKMAD